MKLSDSRRPIMLTVKKVKNSRQNCRGFSFVIFWILGISLMHTIEKGDHLHIGLCIGPFEYTMGFSIWRKLLP